jgi:hypothetical protein
LDKVTVASATRTRQIRSEQSRLDSEMFPRVPPEDPHSRPRRNTSLRTQPILNEPLLHSPDAMGPARDDYFTPDPRNLRGEPTLSSFPNVPETRPQADGPSRGDTLVPRERNQPAPALRLSIPTASASEAAPRPVTPQISLGDFDQFEERRIANLTSPTSFPTTNTDDLIGMFANYRLTLDFSDADDVSMQSPITRPPLQPVVTEESLMSRRFQHSNNSRTNSMNTFNSNNSTQRTSTSGTSKPKPFYQLLKPPILARPMTSRVQLTAISATGQNAVILTSKKFWVFHTNPASLACAAEFTGNDFKYGRKGNAPQSQHPPPDRLRGLEFSCVALNDSYLAIGVPGRILIFLLVGKESGRWVVHNKIHDSEATIERLKFSPDGKQLLAILRAYNVKTNKDEVGAYVYDTETFPKDHNDGPDRRSPETSEPKKLTWTWDLVHCASGAEFSRDGTMIAICTTHSQAHAEIRVLKKFNNTWKLWGVKEVTVFSGDHKNWHGKGLTGISLYHPY